MKRTLLLFVLTISVLLSITVSAYADNGSDYLDQETGTSFTVTAGWHEDEVNTDKEFWDYKIKSDDEIAMILYGSYDSWAALPSADREGYTRETYDMSVFSDDDLIDIATTMGGSEASYKRVTIAGQEYAVCDTVMKVGALNATIRNYITLRNGYMYFFEFSSDDHDTHMDDFISLLDSVKYRDVSGTNGYQYTDSETGVKFTVPAGWSQYNLTDNDVWETRFISDDGTALALYTSMDAWSELTSTERAGYTRETYDVNAISERDLQAMATSFGDNNGTYVKEVIAGQPFVIFETKKMGNTAAEDFDHYSNYMTLDNGYVYFFNYSGPENEHFEEFQGMVRSLKLVGNTSAKVNAAAGNTTNASNHNSSIVVTVIVIGLIALGIGIFVRARKKAKTVNATVQTSYSNTEIVDDQAEKEFNRSEHIVQSSPEYETSTESVEKTDSATSTNSPRFCPYCGKELESGSKFCPYCGNKVQF